MTKAFNGTIHCLINIITTQGNIHIQLIRVIIYYFLKFAAQNETILLVNFWIY